MFKKIVFYVISSGIGTFACKILESTPFNVWIARGLGCAVAVIAALVLYPIWFKEEKGGKKKRAVA